VRAGAFQHHLGADAGGEAAAQVQAEADAARPPGARLVDLVEALEDALAGLARDAWSLVGHEHVDRGRAGPHPHGDGGAGRRVLARVADHVGEDLVEPVGVAADRPEAGGDVGLDQVPAVGAELLEHLAEQDAEVDVAEPGAMHARLQHGHHQQVLEQPVEAPALPVGRLQQRACGGRVELDVVAQQGRQAPLDRRERAAQLVGDGRDEVVLEPVGLPQPPQRHAQPPGQPGIVARPSPWSPHRSTPALRPPPRRPHAP